MPSEDSERAGYKILLRPIAGPLGIAQVFSCFFCEGHILKSNLSCQVEIDSELHGLCCSRCQSDSVENLRQLLMFRSSGLRWFAENDSFAIERILRWLKDNAPVFSEIQGDLDHFTRLVNLKIDEAEWLADYAGFSTIEKETIKTSRSGYIYLLGCTEGYCKIGRTKFITQRLLQIGLQIPFRVEILHSFQTDDMIQKERELHEQFASARQNGEWFLLSADEISWFKTLRG